MELAGVIEIITAYGIIPGLFFLFILYYIKKEKRREEKREEQMSAQTEHWKNEMVQSNEIFRKLVDTHLAEGIRREELMRQEAEKRENIIRQESEKREAMLMRTIDDFGGSMEKLSDSMNEISKTLVQIDFRITNMEQNIGRGHGK